MDRAVAEELGAPALCGLVGGTHDAAPAWAGACAAEAQRPEWRRVPAQVGSLAVWEYAYSQFGLVPYRGRVVIWPCTLPLTFFGLFVPVQFGTRTAPAFVVASERRRRCDATPPALRKALGDALRHVGFDFSAIDRWPHTVLPAQPRTRKESRASLCDVYVALLVRHRIVVHGCRYCQLPRDFRRLDEVAGHTSGLVQEPASGPGPGSGSGLGPSGAVVPADSGAQAYYRRMYGTVAVPGASLAGFMLETARWLRDVQAAGALPSFLQSLGARDTSAARVTSAVNVFLDSEAQAEAERDLALLHLLDGDDGEAPSVCLHVPCV